MPVLFYRAASRRGFTLIEVLTALAVLLIMMLMVSLLMNTAVLTTSNSTRHLNAEAQARMVFDRMQLDLAAMPKRKDIYFQLLKQPGNDAFYFYSQAPGFFDSSVATAQQSNVTLVGYSINGANQLQRLSRGLSWPEVAFMPSTFAVNVNDVDFHVLSHSVFRLEIAFLLKQDDNTFVITDTPPAPGTQAVQNLWALLVAVGVLDTDSGKTVNNYSRLISALHDFTGTQILSLTGAASPGAAVVDPILNSWNNSLTSPTFYQDAGIPKAAAAQVRIYERAFILKSP